MTLALTSLASAAASAAAPAFVPVAAAGFGVGFGLIAAIGAQNAYILRTGVRGGHLLAVVLVCMASDVLIIAGAVAGVGHLHATAPWVMTMLRWGGVAFLVVFGLYALSRAVRPGARALVVDDTDAETAHTGGAITAAGNASEGTADSPDASAARRLPGSASSPTTVALAGEGGAGDTLDAIRAPRTVTAGRTDKSRRVALSSATSGQASLSAAVLTALALTWLNPHVYVDVAILGTIAGTYGDPGRWIFGAGVLVASLTWFSLIGFGARVASRWLASPTAWRILDGVIAVTMLGIATSLALG